MKITQLTENQVGLQSEWAARWIAIGLSTEPADRPRAERAIPLVYRAAGLKPPRGIVWFQSPRAMIEAAKGRGDSVAEPVSDTVWGSVTVSVSASVLASVWSSVAVPVSDTVGGSVGDSVWDSVGDSVWDSVGASVIFPDAAHRAAFYDYFREIVGLREQTEPMVGLIEMAQSAGGMMPFKTVCYLCERPRKIKPEIVYPDGWTA